MCSCSDRGRCSALTQRVTDGNGALVLVSKAVITKPVSKKHGLSVASPSLKFRTTYEILVSTVLTSVDASLHAHALHQEAAFVAMGSAYACQHAANKKRALLFWAQLNNCQSNIHAQ